MTQTGDVVSERTWLGVFVGALVALVGGSLAFPATVYRGFLWKYFWGPVYSDAHNARCAVLDAAGTIELYGSDSACQGAADAGSVAYTGYTLVSEVGYIITLVFMVIGVLLLISRLGIGEDRELFFALVPFMLFGGAFRVVEDAFDTVPEGVETAITYPLNTLLISPIIYVTVFVITLAALLVSMALEREGIVDDTYNALATIGLGVLGATVAYLFYIALTLEYVSFYPGILVVDLVGATVIAVVVYKLVDVYKPEINAGTGYIGLVVIWAHAVDGVANVIAADWATAFGVPFLYGAKHPANQIIINLTETFLPSSLATALGTSWPFLLVKVVVAVGIVWLFDERIMEDSRRYALLLLIAAVAVGLGPGTRDMLRVTFAI
jgi:uncharacterized membrane protein